MIDEYGGEIEFEKAKVTNKATPADPPRRWRESRTGLGRRRGEGVTIMIRLPMNWKEVIFGMILFLATKFFIPKQPGNERTGVSRQFLWKNGVVALINLSRCGFTEIID